ncbi:autotransporter outer membrane beta-barrel domain-containing protein [Novosphingobium kaempferiae]|uniref:autotransporter outer membrane beta-barrel domain-containing protein n=1 Tax=Novosphingobium kaempferiae TaxID=2896849 RepID=UPI001E2A32AD|nr:autotransporter outer membrane beta-barrel domain-containing protein [Novosphingobium kaempferiae]
MGDIENSSGSSRSIRVESKGDVVIDAGSVTSRGTFDAKAIDVMTEGAVVVRAENVLTSGYNANAIDVRGATADIHVTGDVVTGLDQSLGIHVRSNSGQANVKVDGTIFTNGIGSKGLYAVGSENVFLSVNEVITKRDGSYGVVGVSTGGDVEIVSNTVATDGANSVGLYGAVHDAYGTGFTGDVTIEAGNIATRGANSVGAAGINTTVGGNVTITVKDVTTRRENAFGVLAYSAYGSGTVVAGNISTRGPAAKGIMVDVNQKADVTANSVSTLGDVSTGITAWSFMGSKVSVAKVETSGPGSHGVDGLAGFQQDLVALRGDVDLTVGEAITHGDLSIGILAKSAYGDVNVAAGSITTSGDDSIGLFVQSFGNIKARDKVISELNVDSVSTKGKFSDAVYFGGELSELNLVAGDLSTKGDNASGVRTFTTATNQDIVVDNVTTDGVLSRGIFAHSVAGDINVKVNGTITTSGQDAVGIRTNSSVSHVTIEAGHIVTTGDKAQGIYSFLVGIGSARVADIKVETITTAGAASHGIYVYNLNGGVIAYSQEAAMADAGTSVSQVRHLDGHDTPTIGKSTIPTRTVKAGSFVPGRSLPDMFDVAATDGAGLNDITIEAGKIEVGGKGANGIFVRGSGRVTTKIGSVKAADAEAIKISALAENTLAIAGSVTSGNNDAVFLSGSDVSITMAGGSKVGGQNGIVALANGPQPDGEIGIPVEPGIGLPEEPGIGIPGGPEEPGIGIGIGGVPSRGAVAPLDGPAGGTVRIENAGTISGVMKAIDIGAGTAIINNRGVIDGAVVTGGGDDSFVNSGTWMFAASGSYANDFGAGNDTLVNSGIVRLATPTGGKAGKGWIYGLDRFENSGTLSLQNGVAGDILTLDGNYVASGKARLGIDIGGNGKVADTLVVEGAATGSTSISLTSTDGYGATLLNGPLKIVTVGAGSSANAFTLESTDIGFVRYGLTYDAASRSYSVLSTAGAPVYRFARLNEGAQSIWLKSAEAFTTHMRTSRDLGDPGKRIWGQMSGGVSNRDETRAVAGGNGFAAASYDLDYRQDFYGGELGFDAVQGEGVTAGIMGGYTSSTQRFKANGDKGRTDALNVGVYGGVTKGVVFANLLVKYDHFSTHVSSQEMDWNDKIGGHSIGVQGEVGARLGSAKFFVEPAASLAWQSTSLGDIEALDQKIAFDKADGLRGRIGARLGGVTKLGGTELTFYGAGDFVHEFKGKDGATLLSGGQSVWVPGARMDDYGQATLGLDIKGSGPVSGFIQGSGTFGSSYSGVDGRAGIRFAF